MKTCFIDRNGTKVLEVPYNAAPFSDGMSRIHTLGAGAKYGFINKTGEVVVPLQFDSAGYFYEGLAYVCSGHNYGYINKKGKIVIDLEFEQAGNFREGLASVRRYGKWGYVNKNGSIVINPMYPWADCPHFSEGLAPIQTADDRWGYINKKGAIAIEPTFEDFHYFSEGFASVKENGLWGFIDKHGSWVIKPGYLHAGGFSEGLAYVWEKHIYPTRGYPLYIDKKGKAVIDFKNLESTVEEVSYFHEGLAAVKINGRWGFINVEGDLVIETKFGRNVPPEFSQGLVSVEENRKYVFINRNGKVVIETDAWIAFDFSEGLASLEYR